jgi:hypothetical protein
MRCWDGRCLLALGRPAGAREPLPRRERSSPALGATSALTETGKYLARATALTG